MQEADLDRLVDDDTERGLFRVRAEAFTDPEIFEIEKKRVFADLWYYAAHESELKGPGSFVTRRVANKEIILAIDSSGELNALVNTCSHRGAIVCTEVSGCARVFTCRYHGWGFDLKGRLVGLPGDDAYDNSGFDRNDYGLTRLRVASYQGFIFVTWSKEAPSLPDFLGNAKEFLDLTVQQGPSGMEVLPGSYRYAIRANWKLVAENGIDNYHFRTLHRRYVQFVRDRGGEPEPGGKIPARGIYFGNGHGGNEHEGTASLGRLAGRWGPLFPEELRPHLDETRKKIEALHGPERATRITQGNRNVRLFPNMYILDSHHTTIRTFFPTSVDYVEVTEWALAARDERPELREARLRLYSGLPGPASFLSPEDIDTLELCQRGLKGGDMPWIDCSRGMKRESARPMDELQHRGLFRHWHERLTQSRVRHTVNT